MWRQQVGPRLSLLRCLELSRYAVLRSGLWAKRGVARERTLRYITAVRFDAWNLFRPHNERRYVVVSRWG
jgi:hypothetical protein